MVAILENSALATLASVPSDGSFESWLGELRTIDPTVGKVTHWGSSPWGRPNRVKCCCESKGLSICARACPSSALGSVSDLDITVLVRVRGSDSW